MLFRSSVAVTDANGCQGTASQSVTVNQNPSVSISANGPTTFCQGGSVVLSASAGSSYNWSTGASAQSVTVDASGNYSVAVTDANGCQGTASQSVVINPRPAIFMVSGGGTYCSVPGTGVSILLSGSETGVNYTFSYTGADSSVSLAGTGSSLTANGFTQVGTVTASAVNAITGCSNNMNGSATVIQQAATRWYADGDGDGYGSTSNSVMACSKPAGFVANASDCNDGNASINPAAAEVCNGFDDNCDGAVDNGTPALPTTGIMSGPVFVCRSTSGNVYSVAPVAGATSYLWSLPTGATGSSTSNSITLSFSSTYAGGNICVTPRNACGSGSQRCLTNSVLTSVPSQPGLISGLLAGVCSTETRTYSVAVVSGASSYTWTVPTGSSIVSGQGTNSIVVQFSSGFTSGTLGVKANNCLGSSASRAVSISRNTTTPASVSGPFTSVCPGSRQTYSTGLVDGASVYTWAVPAGAVINSGQGTNSISVTFPVPFSSGVISVNSGTACFTSSNRSLTVAALPSAPSSITGPTIAVCGGSTQTYACPVSTSGATFYTWSVPSGAVINSGQGTTSVTVTFPAGFLSGNVSVTAGNACGNSSSRTVTVRSVPAQPGTITGTSSGVCGGPYTYSIAAVANASSYSWTVPAGCTINSNTGTSITMSTTAAFISGNISVTANNACGSGTARTLAITRVPATPSVISGPTSVCPLASGLAYSVTNVAGLTYNWTLPTGASVLTGAGTNAITARWGSVAGSISVRAANACTTSSARSLSVALAACRNGLDEGNLQPSFSLFPNPGNGRYQLMLHDVSGSLKIRVYNMLGTLVFESESEDAAEMKELNLTHQPSGIYLLKFTSEGFEKDMKVVKN